MTAPAGSLSLALEALRDALAGLAALQTWAGAADAAAAKARIHVRFLTPPAGETYTAAELETLRPFCLLYGAPDGATRSERLTVGGAGTVFRAHVEFVQSVPAGSDEADKDLAFANAVGNVRDALHGAGLTEGSLCNPLADVVEDVTRFFMDREPTQGEAMRMTLSIEWGS